MLKGFFSSNAETLIIARVNAPVVQIYGTGVTGEEENIRTSNTCSLSDDYVYRLVHGQEGTGVSGC